VGLAVQPVGPALAAPDPIAAAVAGPAVPDWPTATAGAAATAGAGATAGAAGAAPAPATPPPAVPDWPDSAAPADTHVVERGECLWLIAAGSLRGSGRYASDGEIATAAHAWWSANATVVGPDPDLLLPGQVLHQPQETR
jgi:hypothetical protein